MRRALSLLSMSSIKAMSDKRLVRLSACRLEGRPCLFESLEVEPGRACRFEHKFLCRQDLFDSRMEVWNDVWLQHNHILKD